MSISIQIIPMDANVDEVILIREKYVPMVAGIGEVINKTFSTWAGNIEVMTPFGVEKINSTCKNLWLAMAIQWNGDIVICCRDYDGVTKMGNIKENTIEEIWNSDKYNELREALQNGDFTKIPFCERC